MYYNLCFGNLTLIRNNGGIQVKAALFDMDGVLCDTQQYHHSCYVEIARDYYGVNLDNNISNKLKGVLRYEGAKVICKAVNIKATDENIKYISDLKNELYLKKVEEKKDTLLCEGVLPLLKRLKANNVKMAVASASSNAKFIIKLTKIDKYFDHIVDLSNIKKGKPNPAIFLDAASHLAVKPSDCVVYEDAIGGIQAANDGGMYSIAVNIDFKNIAFTYGNKTADRSVKTLNDPLCYKGLYENSFDKADDSSLFIFDAGNVVLNNIHCFNGIFDQFNFSLDQRNEFVKDFNFYTAPLMDGNISTEFFLSHVNKTMNVNLNGNPFYDHFKPEFNEEIVSLIKKLRKVGKRVVLGSNTFSPHTQKMKEMGLFDLFDAVYVSNEMHRYKPNPSFFRYILEKENVDNSKAYFIDDMSENIAAAAALNINTLHYINNNKDIRLKEAFSTFI